MSAPIKNNFNGGEIDADKHERSDLKKWHNAVALARNAIFDVSGGLRSRPGLAHRKRLRRRMLPVPLSAGNLSAPSGGDPGLLLEDGDFTVSAPPVSAVLVLVDLGAPTNLTAVDVLGYSASVSGDASDAATLSIETSGDGDAWQGIGAFVTITDHARSRRCADDDSRQCRYIRLTATSFDGVAVTAYTLKSLALWVEGDEISPIALVPRGDHVLAITDQHGEIYEAGERRAALPLAISAGQMGDTTSAGELATILLYNQQFRPVRIRRQSADEWNVDHPDFANIPQLSPSSALEGKSGDMMSDANGWPTCGCFYQSRHFLGGFPAAPSTYIASRLGQPFDFIQDFGTAEEPDVTPDAGIEDTLGSDEPEVIRRIYVGRHLQIFTDKGEWYVSSRSIDATEPRNVVLATRHGIAASPRVAFVDGGTWFAQDGGGVIRDFHYEDVEQSYSAEAATLWCPHLIGDVVSMGRRRTAAGASGDMVFAVNADGSAVDITVMRAQEVQAGAGRIETDGKVRSVAIDGNRRVFLAVEREVGGRSDLFLEEWDASRLLDASIVRRFDDAETLIDDLFHLEGKTVWAIVDGAPEGPYRVENASILTSTPGYEVEVGIDCDFRVADLPMRQKLQDGSEDSAPHRIHKLTLAVEKSGPLRIRVGGYSALQGARKKISYGPWRLVAMDSLDGVALDVPLLQRLHSGDVVIDNLRGWYKKPFIEIERAVPCPVFIKSIVKEAA